MSESHRYTVLAAGASDTAVVLASTSDHLDVGDTIYQAEMPPLPGLGTFVWLDLGTTIDRSGEYPDDATPNWRGVWVVAEAEFLAAMRFSQPSAWLCYSPPPIERERNALAAQLFNMSDTLRELMCEMQGHAGSLVQCWRHAATCIDSGGETMDPDDQAMDPATLRRCADLLEKAIASIVGGGR